MYVKVCVLRDDGAMLSVALNAAAAALMDSGTYGAMCTYSVTYSVTYNVHMQCVHTKSCDVVWCDVM